MEAHKWGLWRSWNTTTLNVILLIPWNLSSHHVSFWFNGKSFHQQLAAGAGNPRWRVWRSCVASLGQWHRRLEQSWKRPHPCSQDSPTCGTKAQGRCQSCRCKGWSGGESARQQSFLPWTERAYPNQASMRRWLIAKEQPRRNGQSLEGLLRVRDIQTDICGRPLLFDQTFFLGWPSILLSLSVEFSQMPEPNRAACRFGTDMDIEVTPSLDSFCKKHCLFWNCLCQGKRFGKFWMTHVWCTE